MNYIKQTLTGLACICVMAFVAWQSLEKAELAKEINSNRICNVYNEYSNCGER